MARLRPTEIANAAIQRDLVYKRVNGAVLTLDGSLDAVVQVQMLGEGADYPTLSVAAIFRRFRHLVPYVQFVDRTMRVIKQDSPGDRDNRGFVVSHVGLNVDRWWQELRSIDDYDQLFFQEIANSERDFGQTDNPTQRKRFAPDMKVIDEKIRRILQTGRELFAL